MFVRPTDQAFSMIACGKLPSRSSSHATGRISCSAKSCASSRSASCSSLSVKSTIAALTAPPCRAQLASEPVEPANSEASEPNWLSRS